MSTFRSAFLCGFALFLPLALSPAAGTQEPEPGEDAKKPESPQGNVEPRDDTSPPEDFLPSELDFLQADLAGASEPWDARRYYRQECRKCHGRYGDGDPEEGVPAFASRRWIDERSHHTEELVEIIFHGKDKMEGHAGRITEEQARELLEGVRTIAKKYVEGPQ